MSLHHNLSYWERSQIQYPADFTIIGAGIVGLSTAISLKSKDRNATVVILERGHLPMGASTKNAGFACFGSVSELLDDIDNVGVEKTMDIVNMRLEGLRILKKRCGLRKLDYRQAGGSEIFRKEDVELKDKCLDKMNEINTIMEEYHGIKRCYITRSEWSPKPFDKLSIFNSHEGVLNPMKMMMTLQEKCYALGVQIYYGMEIESIEASASILTAKDNFEIGYKHLIVCTNGFTQKLFPEISVIPARNQVLITKPIKSTMPESGYHLDHGYVYFRRVGDRILLGGGRNRDLENETTTTFGTTDSIKNYLIKILEQIHPNASNDIDMWWSGVLGVGDEKFPIIKSVDSKITVGVRLGGMGVAIGSFLGESLANKVLGT